MVTPMAPLLAFELPAMHLVHKHTWQEKDPYTKSKIILFLKAKKGLGLGIV